MKAQTKTKPKNATALLTKADPTSPCLIVTGRDAIAIKAGTAIADYSYGVTTSLVLPEGGLEPGADYGVVVRDGAPAIGKLTGQPSEVYFAGFHFAPGGNAEARSGGDKKPAINPWSLWDLNFRPSCPDPRGMALIDAGGPKFWCDIYLLGADHVKQGTSSFGATIADGNDPPANPAGGRFKKLDYATAVAVMKHHGKALLSVQDFFAAAYGVTEKTAHSGDPKVTGLDAPRTSKWGLMQATGNMWAWGHDGDPDEPRAALLGGSWLYAGYAGSRYAGVGHWPGDSNESVGARGRGDHLQLA